MLLSEFNHIWNYFFSILHRHDGVHGLLRDTGQYHYAFVQAIDQEKQEATTTAR